MFQPRSGIQMVRNNSGRIDAEKRPHGSNEYSEGIGAQSGVLREHTALIQGKFVGNREYHMPLGEDSSEVRVDA
jgi:hypothetical protein